MPSNNIRVKITGDGASPGKWKVVDAETGRSIEALDITINWPGHNVGSGLVTATMTVPVHEFDATLEAEVIESVVQEPLPQTSRLARYLVEHNIWVRSRAAGDSAPEPDAEPAADVFARQVLDRIYGGEVAEP